MHVIGLREAIMAHTADDKADHVTLTSFLDYTVSGDVSIAEGDLYGGAAAPRYLLGKEPVRRFRPGSPMHNPYGQWRLLPLEVGGARPRAD